jgi:hypothetical protein
MGKQMCLEQMKVCIGSAVEEGMEGQGKGVEA